MTNSTPSPQPAESSNTNSNAQSKVTQLGFPPLAIKRIEGAFRLNAFAIYMIYVAIVAFVIFGTLASLKSNHDNQLMYQLFHYLPYGLIGLSIPIIIYNAFVLFRYRLSQTSMLVTCLVVAIGLLIWNALLGDGSLLWLSLSAWVGMAFLFRANFKRFFKFLEENKESG